MLLTRLVLILSLLAASLAPQAGWAVAPQNRAANPPAVVASPDEAMALLNGFTATGLNLPARDPAVRPGDDFNMYANGAWIRLIRGLPGGEDLSYSIQAQLSEDVEAQLKAIIEAPSGDPAARQINGLYLAFMDEARLERLGAAPLRPFLRRIAGIRTRAELLQVFVENGYNMPFSVGVIPDPANPTRHIASLGQGGLLMPTRDYYLRDGPEFDRYRAAYRTYLTTILRLIDAPNPEAQAEAIWTLERRLADAHWAPERSRDVSQSFNRMTPAQLSALAPQFDWPRTLAGLGMGDQPMLLVGETTAIAGAGRLLEEVPLETWKAWLAFHIADTLAPYMSADFDRAHFLFHWRALNGMQQPHSRWRRGVQLADGAFGDAIGRIYVARHYASGSTPVMAELIGNMRAAFTERLRRLDWMDDATRAEALAKLASFEAQIGGPERTIDYSSVRIDPADLVGNIMRLSDFGFRGEVAKLREPVDRGRWHMSAHTVGASYNVLTNQITFPAAILQPPFFHPHYDAAVNYGRIGAAIGHELGHGFDDQGRRFDGQGRLRDWWTPAAAGRFGERAQRLGAQFASYEPLPGFRVNAEATMGENIGDLGGLEIAYDAYRRHVARHGEPPVLNGLSGDQRFFLAYAQTWCSQIGDNLLRSIVLTDEHAPPALRVNGIVRNMDAWYRAFDVQPGDRLYLPPGQRVRIWAAAPDRNG